MQLQMNHAKGDHGDHAAHEASRRCLGNHLWRVLAIVLAPSRRAVQPMQSRSLAEAVPALARSTGYRLGLVLVLIGICPIWDGFGRGQIVYGVSRGTRAVCDAAPP